VYPYTEKKSEKRDAGQGKRRLCPMENKHEIKAHAEAKLRPSKTKIMGHHGIKKR